MSEASDEDEHALPYAASRGFRSRSMMMCRVFRDRPDFRLPSTRPDYEDAIEPPVIGAAEAPDAAETLDLVEAAPLFSTPTDGLSSSSSTRPSPRGDSDLGAATADSTDPRADVALLCDVEDAAEPQAAPFGDLEEGIVRGHLVPALDPTALACTTAASAALSQRLGSVEIWRGKAAQVLQADGDLAALAAHAAGSPEEEARRWRVAAKRLWSARSAAAAFHPAVAGSHVQGPAEPRPPSGQLCPGSPERLSLCAVAASSTHHEFESLGNTQHPSRLRYWSSRPSSDPTTPQLLIFAASAEQTAFSMLEVQPYTHYYPFERSSRTYTWRSCRVCFWRLKRRRADEGDDLLKSMVAQAWARCSAGDLLPEGLGELAFDSGELNCVDTSDSAPLSRPTTVLLPGLVVADLVAVELRGRVREEAPGQGYYFAVQSISAFGTEVAAEVGRDAQAARKNSPVVQALTAPVRLPLGWLGSGLDRLQRFVTTAFHALQDHVTPDNADVAPDYG